MLFMNNGKNVLWNFDISDPFLWFLFFPFLSQGQGRTERPKLKATKGKMRETEIERKGE
jgi:hypothetical protein